ncbi:hypothetical protein OAA77_00760 [Gammaproteobacteria bacterium]|nr:hypothetical protein [Gammaproteobacteria bacterium]
MLSKVDIRDFWDVVSSGLHKIKEESNPDWRPEDIYSAVVNDFAELYIDQNEAYCGSFIVLQEKPNPFNSSISLLVWIAYDVRGGAADKYMQKIESIARDKGCSRVEFWTPWAQLAEALIPKGYKTKYYIVEKDL